MVHLLTFHILKCLPYTNALAFRLVLLDTFMGVSAFTTKPRNVLSGLWAMKQRVGNKILKFDEILWCDHSNESYWAVRSCGTVYYAVQGGSNFCGCGWNHMVWPFKWKLLSNTFLWYYLSRCLNSSWVVWLHPYLVHKLTEHSLVLSQVKVVSSKHSHRSSGDIFFVQIRVELCLSTKRVYYTQLAPENKNRLCNSK